ncbi:uncharacterized protein LOC141855426 [Brevipalpus obovatus]|uniref:uncharacterized protein LOC141855426 n=1 Tax=Brevipalpus obovatus TaxID=246614 RepID=UPI003D9DEEAC
MNFVLILSFLMCAIIASSFADPSKEPITSLGSSIGVGSKDKVMMLQGHSSRKLMGSGENSEGSQSGGDSSDGMRQNSMNSNGNRNGGRRSRLRNRLCGGRNLVNQK